MKIDWHINPTILALAVLTVSPGYQGTLDKSLIESANMDPKPLVEVLLIGGASVLLTKSWWPLAGPLGYLAVDYLYFNMKPKGQVVQVDATVIVGGDNNGWSA